MPTDMVIESGRMEILMIANRLADRRAGDRLLTCRSRPSLLL